jgi:hypothetical protein
MLVDDLLTAWISLSVGKHSSDIGSERFRLRIKMRWLIESDIIALPSHSNQDFRARVLGENRMHREHRLKCSSRVGFGEGNNNMIDANSILRFGRKCRVGFVCTNHKTSIC